MPASPWLQTQTGFLLNGTSALIADMALGVAINTTLPPWTVPVTSDLNFTYLRPIRVDAEKLVAHARLVDASPRQATSEVLIHDGNGRLLTHATTRCFLQKIDPVDEDPVGAKKDGPYETPDPYERPLPDELTSIPDMADLSGIEIMRRIGDGTIPSPAAAIVGRASRWEVEPGRASRAYTASRWYTSPAGPIYGGLLAYLVDALHTGAAMTTLDAGTGTASPDL